MLKLAVIVDSGREVGMGHVVRGLTIARELQSYTDIIFVVGDDTAAKQIREAKYPVVSVDSANEIVHALRNFRPTVVIIDALTVNENMVAQIRRDIDPWLVVFDSLRHEVNRHTDVVVNAVMGSDYANRKLVDETTHTLYYYGLKYEVLRKEFDTTRKPPDKHLAPVKRILLAFGGSDPDNITTAALDSLLNAPADYEIDIILGAYFDHTAELNCSLLKHSTKQAAVNIHRNTPNTAALMYNSDLVIASPGLTVFEALCVGVPVIPVHKTEFQRFWFQKFLPTLSIDELGKLPYLIEQKDYADPFGGYIRGFEIGTGKEEVLKAIVGGITG